MHHARVAATVLAVLLAACSSKKKSEGEDQPATKKKPDAGAKGTGTGTATTPTKPPPPLETLGPDPGTTGGEVGWATGFGGLGSDVARELAITPDGDVILVGDFEGDAEFGVLGPKSAVPTGADPAKKPKIDDPKPIDSFVMRLKADGTPTWITTIGGKYEEVANAVAVQADGSIAVAGLFSDVLTAGAITAKSNGSDDMYVAGLDANGAVTWLWTTGGKSTDSANAIVATADGGWLVGGTFISKVPFGDLEVKGVAMDDAFVAKLDPAGAVEWVKTFGSDENERIEALAVDVQGSIYAYGLFQDELTIGKDTLKAVGEYDLMLFKLDPMGEPVWAQSFGGLDNEAAGGIAVDRAGNVTFVGSYDQSIKLGAEEFTARGTADAVIGRVDTDGKLVWAKTVGGKGEDIASAVAADAAGNVLVGGWFEQEVDLGKGAVTATGGTNKDVFVVKLSQAGDTTWVRTLGDKDHDKARAIAIAKDGDAFVAGIYRFTLPVKPPIESKHAPDDKAPQTDGFVMHVDR